MPVAYPEHYTADDYRAWEGDWELIHGAPYAMSPSPSVTHQFVSLAIAAQLFEQTRTCPNCSVLAEMDWDIGTDTVVRPDVMVLCGKTGERVTRAPDIVFEVVSPRTATRDERTKYELYEREGVDWYILVYPELKTAKVYQRVQGLYRKAGDFADEVFTFRLGDCAIDLRFADIWRR
jgi:Uma2 family endonuclease